MSLENLSGIVDAEVGDPRGCGLWGPELQDVDKKPNRR